MTRHDSAMNVGRLHLQPKRPYEAFDDHTSTMAMKADAMRAGIDLGPSRYVPHHRRAARGIVAGVIGGLFIWGFVLLTAWALWRVFFN